MTSSDQPGSLNIMKRRWLQDHQRRLMLQPYISTPVHKFLKEEDDLIAGVIPAVTVVVEGRSICHRISLHSHDGYNSLAKALRRMLVDYEDEQVKRPISRVSQRLDLLFKS